MMDNLLIAKNVLINVTLVKKKLITVLIVLKTESKNQIVIVHSILDSIMLKNKLNVQNVLHGVAELGLTLDICLVVAWEGSTSFHHSVSHTG